MKIYNQDKTQELNENELDFEKGRLQADKLVIAHHEAIPFKQGKTAREIADELTAQGVEIEESPFGLFRVIKEYDDGGRETVLIEAEPDTLAQEPYDEYEDIQVFVPYTAEELKKIADDKRHAELKAELEKIKEDIEQETFGLVRDDFAEKKARAAQIINELRVLEGKQPREVRT